MGPLGFQPSAAAHRQPLVLFAIATAVGIAIDSILDPGGGVWVLAFAVLALVSWFGPPPIRTIAVVALFLPLGAVRRSHQESRYESDSPWQWLDAVETPAIVDGVIAGAATLRRQRFVGWGDERAESQWQTQFEMSLERIRDRQVFRSIRGRVVVTIEGRRDELQPGDRVRVFGQLSRLRAPSNPGENDLRAFDRRRGIHARLSVQQEEQVVVLGANRLHPGRVIASMARSARERLLRHLGDTTGPLAVALVIGQRSFVTPAARQRLLETGTAHLLSVSGLHLAIIVLIAKGFGTLLRLPKGWQLVWIVAVSGLYVAITGGRPPVVRAAILVGMLTLAFVLRRPAQTLNTLALAALVLMFWNPENVFSIGVQLSFLAVATLVIGTPHQGSRKDQFEAQQAQRFEALVDSSRQRWRSIARTSGHWLGRAIWYSGCVTAITTPLVWYQFHVVSPISVVTNVIVAPIMFVALAAGVATVVAGWVADPLAIFPAAICHASLSLIDASIEAAASVPGGHHWLPSPPTWFVALFYIGIVASFVIPNAFRWRLPTLRKWISTENISTGTISTSLLSAGNLSAGTITRIVWITVWLPTAWWMATTPTKLPPGTLEATFIDVGHGTSVVIRGSRDEAWLYDCGRLGNTDGSSRGIDETLWSMGLTRIEGVFLSHADADHFNSLPDILRRFRVQQILTPPGMLERPGRSLTAAREAITAAGVPVTELADGDTMEITGETIEVLHPPWQRLLGNDNANSLVLRIDAGGIPLLLPGDLEPPGTEVLIRKPRLPPGGVLMAPHHGSLTMDAESILHWSRPRETIVSGGQRARKPEVSDVLAVTGSGVHVTAEVGAIRVRIDRSGVVEVRSWRDSPW